jgi:hypothetical protein
MISKRWRKTLYQFVVAQSLIVLAAGSIMIAFQLARLNQSIEWIRSEIPLSMLGN